MTKRGMPKTVAGRRRFQLRYPRTVDQLHGLKQVDGVLDLPGPEADEKQGSGPRE